jgi:membrane fusion protein (multidrug efflux system)
MKKFLTGLIILVVITFAVGVSLYYYKPELFKKADTEKTLKSPAGEVSGDKKPAGGPAKKIPAVVTAKVELKDISRTIVLNGSVEPVKFIKLSAPVEGPILNLNFREGDSITKNTAILSLGRNKAAEASLIAAREEFKKEQEELKSVESLVKSGAISSDQLDRARANYEKARALVAKAEEGMSDFKLSAPWDGVVSKLYVNEGDYATPRAPLIEIFDPESLAIKFSVPETHSMFITPETVIRATFDAYAGRSFILKVSRIYPELERRLRTRVIEAVLSESSEVKLIPGMFVRLSIDLATSKNAVSIPKEALVITPKNEKVVFVVKDNKSELRKVVTGIESDTDLEIKSGIQAGEEIAVNGNEKLKDGMEVKVIGKDNKTGGGKDIK